MAFVNKLAITRSRVMMYVDYWAFQQAVQRIFVWDWKTGDLVKLL